MADKKRPDDDHDIDGLVGNELRKRKPKMAERAKTMRSAAIRLFCLECMGGNAAEVRRCTAIACFLWPYRTGRKRVVPSDP